MWVAHTAFEGDGVAVNDHLSVVDGRIVVTVGREGIIDVLVLVRREINEEIGRIGFLLAKTDIEDVLPANVVFDDGGGERNVMTAFSSCRKSEDATFVSEPFLVVGFP